MPFRSLLTKDLPHDGVATKAFTIRFASTSFDNFTVLFAHTSIWSTSHAPGQTRRTYET